MIAYVVSGYLISVPPIGRIGKTSYIVAFSDLQNAVRFAKANMGEAGWSITSCHSPFFGLVDELIRSDAVDEYMVLRK